MQNGIVSRITRLITTSLSILLTAFLFLQPALAVSASQSAINLASTPGRQSILSQSIQANYTVKEGYDFATRILQDPWDMAEFMDISQWLNHAGNNYLVDIQVADGVFSAQATGNYSEFFPLFPGYEHGMIFGNVGANKPISSAQFSCLYVAMNAFWSSNANNYLIIFWAPSRAVGEWVDPSKIWGQAAGNKLTKGEWKLYQVDLNNPILPNNKPWSYQAYWQALRITPSLVAGTEFGVDWIRLTDCQPVNVTLQNLPAGSYSLWLGTGNPERQIQLLEAFSPNPGGSYSWDVQGIAAGSYKYYVKTPDGNSTIQQGQVTIKETPIVHYSLPSRAAGIDYATTAGNAWNIETSDVTSVSCVQYSFDNNTLILDTLPPAQLPGECRGPGAGESDPRIFLNTQDHGNLSSFRYLSFANYQSGSWSIPDQGMIFRLFWKLERPGDDCWYTSRDIALDTGQHTYQIDLHDPWNGFPAEVTPKDCPAVSWKDQGQVGPLVAFRLDPNENITDGVFHQELDWIRLTIVKSVSQGESFTVKVWLNRPVEELNSITFYYTNDLANPTQHQAQPFIADPWQPNAPFQLRLPLLTHMTDTFQNTLKSDMQFIWDTSGVSPGHYYLCSRVDDGLQQATYCSEAPIQVTVP